MSERDEKFVIQNTNIREGSHVVNTIYNASSTPQFDATKLCEGTGRNQLSLM